MAATPVRDAFSRRIRTPIATLAMDPRVPEQCR